MTATWREIERPVGPQPLPDWLKDVNVWWGDGYANSPSVSLKVVEDIHLWPGKVWTAEGRDYRARHFDGRMSQLTHSGALRPTMLRMFRAEDGSLHEYRTPHTRPGEWVEVEGLATTQQEGFGGAHYHLTMADGSQIVLRGPWATTPPKGYVEVSYVDVSRYTHSDRPWHNTGGVGGLFITADLFIRAMSRFAPHLRLAEITDGSRVRFECLKPHWRAPKEFIPHQEWADA